MKKNRNSISQRKNKKRLSIILIFLLLFSSISGILISSNSNIDLNKNLKKENAQSSSGPMPPAGIDRGMGAGSQGSGGSSGGANQVIIQGVPSYEWYRGCGPTSVGMVIGYYDTHGFDDLVTGEASYQNTYVNNMISSSGNWYDYCIPIDEPPTLENDKSEIPYGDEHDNNCVADFMKTSQSYHDNYYGWSHFSHADNAFTGYVNYKASQYDTSASLKQWNNYPYLTWSNYKSEIDANRPVVMLVDTDGNDETDHFVTAIGYDDNHNYACYDTWDSNIHWYDFSGINNGNNWGIYGAIFYSISSAAQLSYSPTSYDFGNMVGGSTDSTTFEIWNSGSSTLSYSLSESCDWVDISPTSGTSSGEQDTIQINVDTSDLPMGYYECQIFISSTGGDGIFTVSLTVYAPYPMLLYNPQSHDFGDMLEGETDSTTFEIWNGGVDILTYSISESCSWLTVTPNGGSSMGEHDTITINVDTTGLSIGAYQYSIDINSNGGAGVFNVYLFIDIPGGSQELDQQQTIYDDEYNLYLSRWGLQTFKPSLSTLTKVKLFLSKNGNPSDDITVSIKASKYGADITSTSLSATEIPTTGDWVEFDFEDIAVTPGQTYYIVAYTNGGMWTHCYNWHFTDSNSYPIGAFYRSLNGGSSWTKFPSRDFAFKSYGLAEGTPTPILSYNPASYDFGTLEQGETDSINFEIWNSGAETLTYTLTESCNWVTLNPTYGDSTGEHDTITINIDTTGLAPGNHQCIINIDSDGGNGAFNIYVNVEGTPPENPILSYNPTEHDFGDKLEGETDSTTFEIWNSGVGTLTYNLAESTDWLTINPISGDSTGEHDVIDINIDTTGLLSGNYQCDITITSNDGTGTFTLYLTIIDPAVPILSYNPTEHDFGDMLEGETDSITFEVWNSGNGILNYNFGYTCAWVDITPDSGISTGEHNTINVDIDTTSLLAGSYQCDVTIASNGGDATYTIFVTIIEPEDPILAYNPTAYDFGNLQQGETDISTFEIWNNGAGILTYTLTESCSWVTLNPTYGDSTGEHDTITINIDTTGLGQGNHQCTVDITSNGGNDVFIIAVYVYIDDTEQLDQQQTQYDENTDFPIYLARQAAQSFKPTFSTITKVELYLTRTGTPPQPITVSIRETIKGSDLTSINKDAEDVPSNGGWVIFNFPDLSVNPGNTYYIIVQTVQGMWTHCYNWNYKDSNAYANGDFYRSLNYGSSWTKISNQDFAFKTFGSSTGPIYYTLTINGNGQGTVTKNPNKVSYTPGETVTLTANPSPGWAFTYWTGDITGSTNPKTITMNSHKTVTAHFSEQGYGLNVNIVGDGTVSKSPDQANYPPGTNVQLTANPSPGWTFSHWSGDLIGSTNPISIEMNEDKIITANFNQQGTADQLDQEQAEHNDEFDIYLARQSAQSFKPTLSTLTKVELYLSRSGSPQQPITVSIRETIDGGDLTSISKTSNEISSDGIWVQFNFADISVNPGSTYYIIAKTTKGMWTHCYNWHYMNSNEYSYGAYYDSLNYGSSWTKYSNRDYAFRTFGI